MQESIVDDERQSHAPQIAASLRAAAATGRLLCRSSSTYLMNTPSSSLLAFVPWALAAPLTRVIRIGS